MNEPGRLPRPLSTLVGRRQELSALERHSSDHRLVTIVGPGGAGKTRLAVELGAKLQSRLDNPVLFVDLSALHPNGMVASQVASAAGIPEKPGRPLVDTIAERLPAGPGLIVLDNCEQVLQEAAEVVEKLLSQLADLSFVATSRRPLGVQGEVAWPVPPLSFPDAGRAEPKGVGGFDAVRLFVDRAAHRQPGYQLSEESAEVVAGICRQLDGMPLAIELASAWLGVLGEAEILERVVGDITLLETDAPGVPARHRSMAAAIQISYDLLEPRERRIFSSLGVFSGRFTLEEAEAITAGPETLFALSALVRHSLVVAETGPGRPASYRLLETIRQFAARLLDDDPDGFEVRHRHAAHFLTVAEEAESERQTLNAPGWIRRLAEYRNDFQSALEWSVDFNPDQAVQLAGALSWFWHLVATTEGVHWLARVLERPTTEDRFRSRATDWAGWLQIRRNDFEAARNYIREGLRISEKIGDKAGIARALIGLGPMAHFGAGDPVGARRMVEEGLRLAREAEDRRQVAASLSSLGGLALLSNELDRAVELLSEAFEVHRRSGNLGGMGISSVFLAVTLSRRGEDVRAYEVLSQALGWFEQIEGVADMAVSLELMAVTGHHLDLDTRVRVWAAGNAALEREGAGRPPFWKHEAWPQAQKDQLGARWDRLWEQGSSLTVDQAVALTRGKARSFDPKGWEKLSRREREVAELVAEGLTNRELAERLFISERTAESHVRSILTRLGFTSRSQIAAWAAPGA